MSRIGNSPIPLPEKVEVAITPAEISVKGPLGTLTQKLSHDVTVAKVENRLEITAAGGSRQASAMSGTLRALIANMVTGVSKGFEKRLTLVGVGYRAAMKGNALSMQLGFSHEVDVPPPAGISFAVPKQTEIKISGIDKQQVGEIAAQIRRLRPPEPYKGKGVRYAGEQVRRKEGKKK